LPIPLPPSKITVQAKLGWQRGWRANCPAGILEAVDAIYRTGPAIVSVETPDAETW